MNFLTPFLAFLALPLTGRRLMGDTFSGAEMIPTASDITSLLTQKLSEGQTLAALYLTAFTVYITICGALLKFTMDAIKDGNSMIKQQLTRVGVGTTAVYLLACIFQWIAGQQLSADIEHLNSQIGSPLVAQQMLILRFITLAGCVFAVLALFMWLLAFRRIGGNQKNEI